MPPKSQLTGRGQGRSNSGRLLAEPLLGDAGGSADASYSRALPALRQPPRGTDGVTRPASPQVASASAVGVSRPHSRPSSPQGWTEMTVQRMSTEVEGGRIEDVASASDESSDESSDTTVCAERDSGRDQISFNGMRINANHSEERYAAERQDREAREAFERSCLGQVKSAVNECAKFIHRDDGAPEPTETCGKAWRDRWSKYKVKFKLLCTDSVDLRTERSELASTQNILLHGSVGSVLKLFVDMKKKIDRAHRQEHDEISTHTQTYKGFVGIGDTLTSTSTHKFQRDGTLIDLGFKSAKLTEYFIEKLDSKGWFQSGEFKKLVAVTEATHYTTEQDPFEEVDQIPFWEHKVDMYCRSSAFTLKFLDLEIARIDSILVTKADLEIRLVAFLCSAIAAYGEPLWDHFQEHDEAWGEAKKWFLFLLILLALAFTVSGFYHKCTYDGVRGLRRCDGYAVQVVLGATCVGILLGQVVAKGDSSGDGSPGLPPAPPPPGSDSGSGLGWNE